MHLSHLHLHLVALEHMRKKIELSTEKIRVAKLKEEEAKKVCAC